MTVFALLDENGELLTGDVNPWIGKVLVSGTKVELQKYQDALPHAEAKLMRLTELVPRQFTR